MAVTVSNPSDVILEKLRRQFVPFLRNELHFADYATEGAQPKSAGSTSMRWVLFTKITADETGGLTEGSASDGEITTLSVATVTTTVAEYGAWVKITSLADLASTPETLAEYAKGLGEHAARTLDSLLRNVADGSTTTLNAQDTATGTGTMISTDTAIAQDIAVISGRFNQNDCKGFANLGGMYVVIVHGKVEQDIVTDVTTGQLSWSDVNKYVPGIDGQKKIIQGSPGAIYGTMVLRSNNIATATVSTSVTGYINVALADHGLGRSSFEGMTPKGAKAKGPALLSAKSDGRDTSNPLRMFSTLGWKFNSAQAILDNNRIIVYRSAV